MNPADAFISERERLLSELPVHPDAVGWCASNSGLADKLVFDVARTALEESDRERVAVLAVGGYGRRELSPFSDVDLLVVAAQDADPRLDDVVKSLHRALLLSFERVKGPAFSYAYFLQNDAAALDSKTQTAMLDARLLFGSAVAFEEFQARTLASLPKGQFLLEKIREREAAKQKFNDTPLAVEPNLKEGAGGVRCFHAANWIRNVIGHEPLTPSPAYSRVLRGRNLLHLAAGKCQDGLTRSRQAEVADLAGEEMFRFMAELFEALAALDRNYLETLGLLRSETFELTPSVFADEGKARVRPGATLSGAASGLAVATALGLASPDSAETDPEVDGPEALMALASGEATLRNLDGCGILEKLLPELDRCRFLMPQDAVHSFTVLEHSIRVIRNIENFRGDSFYGRLREGLSSKATLYLAAILHDAGKAVSGRPHSETGAEISRDVAQRWKLAPGVSANVEWLVREHLTMARFIGMRDVADPRTVQEFAEIVGDAERLDMLAILTCADVMGVAPNAWTSAQDAFLKELHTRTSARLESEYPTFADADTIRRRVARSVQGQKSPEAVEAFLSTLPAQYAVNTPPELVPIHMDLAEKAARGEPQAVWEHDRDRNLSEITVAAKDRPGLLSQILGALYAFDLSVYALRASTTSDVDAVALDTLTVGFGGQLVPPSTCALAAASLKEVILGRTDLSDLLRGHGKDPDRRQEHFRFAFIEGSPGILEVQAPRGRGMAFRLSQMIFDEGWDIVSARFGQWAGNGAAAFYVHGRDGRELTREEVEAAVRAKV